MIHPDRRADSVRAARHEFTATGPNRIVDCSIDSRMRARTAVAALDDAVAHKLPSVDGPRPNTS